MKQDGSRHSRNRGDRRKGGAPGPEQMAHLLERCGILLDGHQRDQLWHYHQLLRTHDAELNLTRIHNFENMVVKLYADSILPALQTSLPSPLMDLGSGPGMPGIPLKIFRPDLEIHLAESRRPRIDFLKLVVAELGLGGIEVIERGIAADYDRPVAGVITRAVEPIADTLARIAGCLEKDGRLLFMKGPHCDAEIAAAEDHFSNAYTLVEDIAYQIPKTPHRRRLVCYRRTTARTPVAAAQGTTHRVHTIESESNSIFKDLKKLLGGRGIKKQGKALVCGARLIEEALALHPERCVAWITGNDRQTPPQTLPAQASWLQLAPPLFQALDLFGTRSPIVEYDLPDLPTWDVEQAACDRGCNLLIPFQDPENVGAVIRSAAAFSVDRIVLLAESANPFHPKAIRASAGTVFSANLFNGPALQDLPDALPVIPLAASGRPLEEIDFPDAFCLLPGMEGPGLPPCWQQGAVAIPMASKVESLNAAVATSIALYEWRRGRQFH